MLDMEDGIGKQARSSWNRKISRKKGYYCSVGPQSTGFPEFPDNFCVEFSKGTLSVKALWDATYEKVCSVQQQSCSHEKVSFIQSIYRKVMLMAG